ncbi:Protein C45E1.4 [Aphelenchoides avenae]|nr:Protein C45E1.4 [Aphelenchus avenae]
MQSTGLRIPSVVLLLLCATVLVVVGAKFHSSTPSEYDDVEDESEAHDAGHLEDVDEGNGFENEGIDGHHGLFRVFTWSPEELRSISLWHATAQYQNVVELVKEKMDASSLHPVARQKIETFIAKHRPPQSVQRLLSKEQREQVRHYHHTKDVGRILEVIKHRLAQLSPAAREEVLAYLSFPHRDE